MQTYKQVEIRSNKQIVDRFSKETGITDPKVDTFIAMQDEIKSLGYYPVLDRTTAYKGTTIYGVDLGHYGGWSWGTYYSKQPSGDVFEEAYAGTWAKAWHEHFDSCINPNKYYDGDWNYVEPDDATNDKLKLEYRENQRKGIGTIHDISAF